MVRAVFANSAAFPNAVRYDRVNNLTGTNTILPKSAMALDTNNKFGPIASGHKGPIYIADKEAGSGKAMADGIAAGATTTGIRALPGYQMNVLVDAGTYSMGDLLEASAGRFKEADSATDLVVAEVIEAAGTKTAGQEVLVEFVAPYVRG